MLDEFGKSLPTVKNALTRLILERQLGAKKLHVDSLLWATTNLQAEGLGDMLPAHVRNRITTVEMRKPDAMEWIEWGVNNDIDPMILAWAKDTPQLFHSFKDCKPEENPYINHPQAQRASFVSPRSLEKASNILKKREQIDSTTLTASLIGTIGDRGALDLMTTAAGAVCMVVYRSLAIMDRQLIKPWMIYLNRLNKEAQGLFVNGARAKGYSKQDVVTQSKEFQDWCLANNFLFSADK